METYGDNLDRLLVFGKWARGSANTSAASRCFYSVLPAPSTTQHRASQSHSERDSEQGMLYDKLREKSEAKIEMTLVVKQKRQQKKKN